MPPVCDTKPGVLSGRKILFVVNVDWFFLSHRLPLALAALGEGAVVSVAAASTGRGREIAAHGLTFIPIPMTRNRGGIRSELSTVVALAQTYRQVRPDIVHHVTIKPVLYGSPVARLYRIPIVNAISGFGHIFGTNQRRIVRTSVECVYRVALRGRRSYTIFQNREDRDDFTSRRFLPEAQAVLIQGSGVDCNLFQPQARSASRPVIMFGSRMLREKGVEDFVAAARILRPTYPDVRFVLVGGPDDSPTSLTTGQLEGWAREGIVEWWGVTDQMERVLPQASIFVLPTYYREGLPKALLEAGACGLPMITTDIPGCRDAVQSGITGLLVAPHDAPGIARAIGRLLDDDELRGRMGTEARRAAEAHFTVQAVVDRTLDLYRSIVQMS